MISQRYKGGIMMARTIVDLDEKLLKKAMKLSGIKTKVTLVNMGLKSLVRHLEQMEFLQSRGKVQWDGDLDEMRGRVRR
jgi:Arc/MetJ family transcription regulator